MTNISIVKVNEVRMRINTSHPYIDEELNDFFKYESPGFMPSPFSKWDGIVRLYTKGNGLIDIGLLFEVFKFAKMKGYSLDIDPALRYMQDIPREEIVSFVNDLDLSVRTENGGYTHAESREYQIDSIVTAVQQTRCVLLAATSAGKSMILYSMARYYRMRREALRDGKKTLIVVPSIHLVTQLYDNFEEYSHTNGWSTLANVHMIFDGAVKDSDKPIYISTWQGIQKQKKDWFHQFGDVIVDEVHTSKADALSYILNNCIYADQRLGVTGTLSNTEVGGLQVIAHFGVCHEIITARELIDQGFATDVNIEMIELLHDEEHCAMMTGDYQDEIEYLISNEARNRLLVMMAQALKGNTVILFARIDAHMKVVYEQLSAVRGNVFMINGEVSVAERERIKKAAEEGDGVVILASYGTMQQGVSIKRLHNLIFGHPAKSFIRVIQTLGRMMRQHSSKDRAKIFDLVDNLSSEGRYNHALRHSFDRYRYYMTEKHPVTRRRIKL